MTDKRTELDEDPIAEDVPYKQARFAEREQDGRATSGIWNEFTDRHGSFADEHSTL